MGEKCPTHKRKAGWNRGGIGWWGKAKEQRRLFPWKRSPNQWLHVDEFDFDQVAQVESMEVFKVDLLLDGSASAITTRPHGAVHAPSVVAGSARCRGGGTELVPARYSCTYRILRMQHGRLQGPA